MSCMWSWRGTTRPCHKPMNHATINLRTTRACRRTGGLTLAERDATGGGGGVEHSRAILPEGRRFLSRHVDEGAAVRRGGGSGCPSPASPARELRRALLLKGPDAFGVVLRAR